MGDRSPGGPRRRLAQGYPQGGIGDDVIGEVQAQGGAGRLRRLQMSPPQHWLNGGIQQQPNAVAMHRGQPPIPSGKPIQAVPFHIEGVGQGPIQLRPIQHIGMGDQGIYHCRQRSRYGQGIPGIAPNGRPDPRRHNQDGGVGPLGSSRWAQD